MKLIDVSLQFVPVKTRMPLKFGDQVLTEVSCARVKLTVEDDNGHRAEGWGETPLSVAWVWPSTLPYQDRHERLVGFCKRIAATFPAKAKTGHPMVIGHHFVEDGHLDELATAEHQAYLPQEPLPHLAALVCFSAFDLALYDAFGQLHQKPAFDLLTAKELGENDLASFLENDDRFSGKFPADFLVSPPEKLPVWHLVGGLDPLEKADLTGTEPTDGYPVLLRDWIRTDGLTCLKVKLRGNDAAWDYQRLVAIGNISLEEGIIWLTTDFNCMVTDPSYVNDILDRLLVEHPRIYALILYVEQPFPYDLKAHRIDVASVSARKPLFLDESAHDWRYVRLGKELGWTGVALKTCKTLTGALLSLCWAKENGMTLMVQDLTNPMLAQIPHVLLAAHAGTIMGVESNAMQFYPEASKEQAKSHPGLYQRRNGQLDLSTVLARPGFGY